MKNLIKITLLIYGFEAIAAPNQKLVFPTARPEKQKSIAFGVGPTLALYAQTDLETVSQTNVTVTLDLQRDIVPRQWLWGFRGYVSAMSFPSSAVAGEGMKLLGGDLRVAYELPWSGYAWPVHMNAGFFATTTFGTESIGYSSVMGPQLYPSIHFLFINESTADFYAKYSPIMSGLSFLSPSNSYLALGAKYHFPKLRGNFLKGCPIGVGLDISRLTLNVRRGTAVVTAYTVSLDVMFQ